MSQGGGSQSQVCFSPTLPSPLTTVSSLLHMLSPFKILFWFDKQLVSTRALTFVLVSTRALTFVLVFVTCHWFPLLFDNARLVPLAV